MGGPGKTTLGLAVHVAHQLPTVATTKSLRRPRSCPSCVETLLDDVESNTAFGELRRYERHATSKPFTPPNGTRVISAWTISGT
jgi:hypothetical protein